MDWRESLAGVDVDYLVGISNKGIVKRAYKDLEAGGNEAQAAAGLDWTAQELTVEAGGEAVTIRFPLGESRCSCPSRSICRHVIMAILLAQQAAAGDVECRALNETATENGEYRALNETATENVECRALSERATENVECRAPGEAVTGSGECPPPSKAATGNSQCTTLNKAKPGDTDYAECCAEESATVSGVSQNKSQVKSFGGERQGDARAEGVSDSSQTKEKTKGKSEEKGSGDLGQLVWQEILTQPRKSLLRALGSRGLRRLTAAMETGNAPQVERSTVVRMQLPGQDITVKLLSPLEYSTCTCHKKELCSHKAEAILWCQYLEKQLTVQDLKGELEQEPAFDLQELWNTAGQVKGCLEHLLETGLARSGTEQAQELERLAILCHNAGLPGWEGDIRALAEGYEKYLRRAAGQSMEKLAGQLQRLYGKTTQLETLVDRALSSAKKTALNGSEPEYKKKAALNGPGSEHKKKAVLNGPEPEHEKNTALNVPEPEQGQDAAPQHAGSVTSQIQALAGEFRSEYLPVGDLELTGITVEHFVSDSGYEGDTVYFLEMNTGTWYTYTSARPTFYEGKKRRGYQEKAPAPWGVSLPLEGLASVRIQLRGAKCDAGGRLSSSQETRGEILGKSELTAAKLEGWYYQEYDRLFEEQIPKPGQKEHLESGSPRLVFVQASRFEQGKFNQITQKLELPIWDEAGRKVLVELPYTKRDEASIRYLERLKKQQQPCFLGRVYLQGSMVCLYPVDLLERQELGDEISQSASSTVATECDGTACQALQSHLEEVSWLLQEIYQVGSATVQDSTLEALERADKQSAAYGMTTLSDWLRQLWEQLSRSRHQVRCQPSESMDVFCRLWQYVQLCRQRTAYDLAHLLYQG